MKMFVTNKKSNPGDDHKYSRKFQGMATGMILSLAAITMLSACGGGNSYSGTPTPTPTPSPTSAPAWNGYGHDAQHSDLGPTVAQGGVAAQNLGQIVWETSIDLVPDQTTAIHYGSPMITAKNTVMVPIKTTLGGGFQLQAMQGSNGQKTWNVPSDYILPAHTWIPSYGATLTSANRVYMPGAGGKVMYIDNPDATTVTPQTTVFYGASAYAASPAAFNSNVTINTPITSD
ncbi:MAG TPA: hypothetical protein VNW52_02630, partial [Burkholderiaceae bacterium]|nr:hypothetical protein [Burkholderiaceae bacterium]